MKVSVSPNVLLAALSSIKQSGQVLVSITFNRDSIEVKFSHKSIAIDSRVSAVGDDGNPITGYMYLADLVNGLSCCSPEDDVELDMNLGRLKMSSFDAYFTFSCEIKLVEFFEDSCGITSSEEGGAKFLIDCEILSSAFLQCLESPYLAIVLSVQVSDVTRPVMEMSCGNSSVLVGYGLVEVVEFVTVKIELGLLVQDILSVLSFLNASVGNSSKVEVTVWGDGIRLCRKNISGDAEIIVLAGDIS